jgi:predicted nucleotidyltransferase
MDHAGRYRHGRKDFQFVTEIDLNDGEELVAVEVEFLAPKEVKTGKNKPKLIESFRVLKTDGCAAAFHGPITQKIKGQMIGGAGNTVTLRVASVPDFLVMKAFALNGRDKPKDAYDICYCLDHHKGGITELAMAWNVQIAHNADAGIAKAVEILKEKFDSVNSFGPMQVVEFHNDTDPSTRDEQARRSFELVQHFLSKLN